MGSQRSVNQDHNIFVVNGAVVTLNVHVTEICYKVLDGPNEEKATLFLQCSTYFHYNIEIGI